MATSSDQGVDQDDLLTARPDGSDVRIVIPNGYASHFIWRDPGHILAQSRHWLGEENWGNFLFEDREGGHVEQIGRGEYVTVTDAEALDAFQMLTRVEGIIPALESSHALAHVVKLAPTLPADAIIIANLSGRGDKDVDFVAERLKK